MLCVLLWWTKSKNSVILQQLTSFINSGPISQIMYWWYILVGRMKKIKVLCLVSLLLSKWTFSHYKTNKALILKLHCKALLVTYILLEEVGLISLTWTSQSYVMIVPIWIISCTFKFPFILRLFAVKQWCLVISVSLVVMQCFSRHSFC